MRRTFLLLVLVFTFFYTSGCAANNPNFFHSAIHSEFPVPGKAKLIKDTAESETYSFKGMNEEDGLPLFYRTEIEKNGWQETDMLGGRYTFTKDKKNIYLYIQQEKIVIKKGLTND